MLQPCKDLGTLEGPLLIFGGPYSNLAATEALLEQAAQLGMSPEQLICTGDVVAYGAEPEATTQLLRDAGVHVVMGNCEESLAENSDDCGCGFGPDMLCSTLSQQWFAYANARVSQQSRDWMAHLPRMIKFRLGHYRCSVIHGGASQINQFIFHSTERDLKQQQLELCDSEIMIGGHCGLPFGETLDSGLWLNAGVIGLPANDATRDGWFMQLALENNAVIASWHRLDYDYARSQRSMNHAGLDDYARSLQTGRWPSEDILPDAECALAGQPIDLKPMRYQLRE